MSKLYPWAEAASAYQIDYQKEYDNGVRGVLFDVDNTLVRHGEPATKQAKELFEHLRSIGLKTCIISNNKEPRVSPFAKEVGSYYIYKAGKPSVRGYEDAMKRIHTTPDTTIFIGDQISDKKRILPVCSHDLHSLLIICHGRLVGITDIFHMHAVVKHFHSWFLIV